MTIDYESIKRAVRVMLDENEDMTPLLGGTDGSMVDNDALQTDQITEDMVLQAVDRVHSMAPAEMLADVTETAQVVWETFALTQRCKLPVDNLRLMYVKLDGWLRGVDAFVPEGTALYSTMFSRFMAVRPTPEHPMVGIAQGMAGGVEIVAAPVVRPAADAAGKVADAAGTVAGVVRYIRMAAKSRTVSERCYHAVLWMVANLYYTVTGNNDRAASAAREVAEELGITANTDMS